MRLYTPEFVAVETPNRHINQSFDLAIQLIDELRQCANAWYHHDGYYAVSDGNVNRCHTWDPRDYDHINKMVSYLWGMDDSLGRAVGQNIFADQLDEADGHYKVVYGSDQRGMHIGHYSKYAADYFTYLGDVELLTTQWERLLKFVQWVFRAYDTLNTGLIEDASDEASGEGLPSFWGYYIGEPEHFPVNLSKKSKPIIASMTFCGLLKAMARFAAEHHLPEGDYVGRQYERVFHKLETEAYNEKRGYYYLQYDAFNQQWYFSLNGICEESREMLVIPYYADEVSGDGERARNVARAVYRALRDDSVFPMPITYPSYRWYGASTQYHYHAFGMNRFLFEGCWDNSYHNCVNLLSSTGMVDVIPEAVRRRSEAACRDGDFTEWYFKDGSVGETEAARQYHRDRYGISATAHIASIVEGLFGIRPARPGFAEVYLQPAFPYERDRYNGPNGWIDSDVRITVTLPGQRQLSYQFRYDSMQRQIRLGTNNVGIPAHVRLPIYNARGVQCIRHGNRELAFTLGRSMDIAFVYFDLLMNGDTAVVVLSE